MRHITKQTDYCKKMTFVYAQSWIRSRADLTIFLMCWMSPGTKNSCRSDITVLIPEADLPVTLITTMTQICKDEGIEEKDIKFFVGDCWHHLRCIWIGAGLKHLDTYLTDLLPEVDDIHFLLRVSTSIEAHLIAIEKEFGATANYAKGHGARFIA